MDISEALAADLALLTEALDEPGIGIADTVRQLAADVGMAVPSFLGLTVQASGGDVPLNFTVLAGHGAHGDVRASLMMPLTELTRTGGTTELSVTLYAAAPGALVDLAADLAWLVGCELDAFLLDRHVDHHLVAANPHTVASALTTSVINQALGVLYSRGLTPQQADGELDTRAAATATDRHGAAARILADLTDADD